MKKWLRVVCRINQTSPLERHSTLTATCSTIHLNLFPKVMFGQTAALRGNSGLFMHFNGECCIGTVSVPKGNASKKKSETFFLQRNETSSSKMLCWAIKSHIPDRSICNVNGVFLFIVKVWTQRRRSRTEKHWAQTTLDWGTNTDDPTNEREKQEN